MKRLLLLILLALSLTVTAQTRRALVIGIGEYPKHTGWRNIHGDTDADSITALLTEAGYQSITTLKNADATKSRIVDSFHNLARKCHKGDIVYIHFSGHGQQMTDSDGDEHDNLDESWIPYDACRKPCAQDQGECHLVDDEIGVLLDSIYNKVGPEGRILVVVDACHSGTSTRGNAPQRGTSLVFQRQKTTVRYTATRDHWILIAACRPDQLNTETLNPSMGILTYALCAAVRSGNNDSNAQFIARMQKIVNRRKTQDRDQTITPTNLTLFNIIEILHK